MVSASVVQVCALLRLNWSVSTSTRSFNSTLRRSKSSALDEQCLGVLQAALRDQLARVPSFGAA